MKKILICFSLILVIFSLSSCGKEDVVSFNEFNSVDSNNQEFSKLVVSSLKETSRQSEVITDKRTSDVPGNGNVITNSKNSILSENEEIYDFEYLDKDGYYYKDGVNTSNQLFKHRGADSQVAGFLGDDSSVIKTMNFRNSIYPSNTTELIAPPVNITGLYAPAGEVIKIEISEQLAALSPKVYIGATALTGELNNIDISDNFTRMPNRVNVITLDKTINYVGNPLGGQIYIQADMDEYEVTISGAVEYFHYIYNTTSKSDLERLYSSTAPMIDIEIPNNLRINMPRNELQKYEDQIYNELTSDLEDINEDKYRKEAKSIVIDNILELGDIWNKYTQISTNVCPADLYKSTNITFFYDSYTVANNIKVGSAFSTFNETDGYTFLDINKERISILENYNKHFWNNSDFIEQGSNDTTAKLLTILQTTLYDTYGAGRTTLGTPGVHAYSDAKKVLNNVVGGNSGSVFELSKYVTLIHSFGSKLFLEAITSDCETDILRDRLYYKFSNTLGYDMKYYFEDIIGWQINDGLKQEIASLGYEMYIPVASSLQIGQIVNGNKIYTTQNYGLFSDIDVSINDSIALPSDMDLEILEVIDYSGVVTKKGNNYFYKLSELTDEFYVKVKVSNENYSYTTTLIMGLAEFYKSEASALTISYYKNDNNLSLEEVDYNTLPKHPTLGTINFNNSTGLMCSVDKGYTGGGIFVTEASMYFHDTKTYTLNARGLGDMRIYFGENQADMKEVVNYKREGSSSSYDLTDESRTFDVDVIAHKKYTIKIVLATASNNTTQRVEFWLGYKNGNTVSNLPNDYFLSPYAPYNQTGTKDMVYNNPDNLDLDDINYFDLEVNRSFYQQNSGLMYQLPGNNVGLTYAHIVLPDDKVYKLYSKGLGEAKISIGTSYDNLEEVVRYSTNVRNEFSEENSFTLDGSKSRKYILKREIKSTAFDGAQRTENTIGYLNDNNVIENLPDAWWNGSHTSNHTITPEYKPYDNPTLFDKDHYLTTYSRIDEKLNIIYQTNKLDEKFLTTPNSEGQKVDPGAIVIYKYHQKVTANYFAISSASSTEGIVSFVKVHVSNNGVDWTEAFNGVNPNEKDTILALNKGHTFQYVKLEFLSSYTEDHIQLCNFEFQLRATDLKVEEFQSNDILYSKDINIVDSKFNLNNNIVEFNGTIKFSFTGSTLILFSNTSSKYGLLEVKVDGVSYKVDLSDSNSYSKLVFSLAYLEDKTHDVEIKVLSGLGNIDYIAVG